MLAVVLAVELEDPDELDPSSSTPVLVPQYLFLTTGLLTPKFNGGTDHPPDPDADDNPCWLTLFGAVDETADPTIGPLFIPANALALALVAVTIAGDVKSPPPLILPLALP